MVQEEGLDREPSDARRAVVLLEELTPKVQLLLEGHTGLARQLDRVVEGLGGVGQRLDRFEMQAGERSRELHQYLRDGFEKVYEDVGKVDKRFVGVHSRLDTLTGCFDAHERAHTA